MNGRTVLTGMLVVLVFSLAGPASAMEEAEPGTRTAVGVPDSWKLAADLAQQSIALSAGRGVERTQTLVVLSGETEAADLAKIVEDMRIMGRILDKALVADFDSRGPGRAMGFTDLAPVFQSGGVQGIYLEGYGVLFLLPKVDFPLTPPPKVEKPEAGPEADSLWERTKREMYSPRHVALRREAPKTEYDAKKVKELQKTVLEALRHAANMRGLKPGESIAVAVLGGGRTTPIITKRGVGGFEGFGVKEDDEPVRVFVRTPSLLEAAASPSQATVLTIHVKKSDVDAFAEGELSLDEFRERATIVTY